MRACRPTSPTTCSTARRPTASSSPTATTTPSRSGGRRRSPASGRTSPSSAWRWPTPTGTCASCATRRPGRWTRAPCPAVWRGRIIPRPTGPLHAMTDSMIAAAMGGYFVRARQRVPLGPLTRTLAAGTLLYPNDILHAQRDPAEPRPAPDRLGVDRRPRLRRARRLRRAARPRVRAAARPGPTRPRPQLDLHRFGRRAARRARRPSAWCSTPTATPGCGSGARAGSRPPARASRPPWGCRQPSWSTPTPGRADRPRMRRALDLAAAACPPIPTSRAALQAVVDSAAPDTGAARSLSRTGPLQQRPNLK